MYRPSNLHNIISYLRNSKSNSVIKDETLYEKISYWMNPGSIREIPLHRWCHSTSEKYKNTCDPWKKVEYANSDNNLCSNKSKTE